MTENPWELVWSDRDAARADWNGYEACFDTPLDYERFVCQATEFIVRILHLGPADSVLDIGCGSGRLSTTLSPYVGNVVGIDFSTAALTVARDRPSENVRYERVDLNKTDLATVSGYAKAIAMGSLHYLADIRRLRELLMATTSTADLLALDIPNADTPDPRPRDYDQSVYRHLCLSPGEVLEWFPHATVMHDIFPGYANSKYRFAVLIPRREPEDSPSSHPR